MEQNSSHKEEVDLTAPTTTNSDVFDAMCTVMLLLTIVACVSFWLFNL